MEPARSLESNAEVGDGFVGDLASLLLSRDSKEMGRKGLVDGVGRDVLGSSD